MCRYFKRIVSVGNGNCIYYGKSKKLSDEKINSITASSYTVTPQLSYYGTKIQWILEFSVRMLEFSGSYLKQDSVTFIHKTVVNICIVYEISKSINIDDYPTLENCLFRAVRLTKNADVNKYKYSGYDIEFDREGSY